MPQAPYTIMRYMRHSHGIDRRHPVVICSYPSLPAALERCLKLNQSFTNWYYEIVALPELDVERVQSFATSPARV